MSPRNTLVLAVVVAVVGAFVWFYEVRGGERREEAERAARRVFPGFEAEEVEWISLRTTDAGVARLERHEGAWRLVEPLSFPADPTTADGLASSLVDLVSETIYEEVEDREQFGFDAEPRLRFAAGGQEQVLRVGDDTPLGGSLYVGAGDSGPVYTVLDYRVNSFEKTLDALRKKRLLDFDRETVTKLRVRWPGKAVALEKAEAGWRVTEPLTAAADERTVEGLLTDLHFLRANGFLDEAGDDEETGLSQPEFEAVLTTRDDAGGEREHRLTVGRTVDGESRAVRGPLADSLYTIPEERLADFPRRVVEYRFKELARFDEAEAAALELVFHDPAEARSTVLNATRGEAGWTSEPQKLAAGRTSRLVRELSDLRATDIAAESAESADLEALGLAPPRVVVRVRGAGEGEAVALADLELGTAEPGAGIVARVAGGDVVYRLDYDLAEHVPISAEALRNRFLSAEEPEPAPTELDPVEIDLDVEIEEEAG